MTATPRFKGVEVDLGGEPHVVPPLTLGAIEDFQDRLKQAGATPDVSLVVDLLHRALQRNYPAITRDQVREGIDIGSMLQVFNAVLGTSGFVAAGDSANPGATAS